MEPVSASFASKRTTILEDSERQLMESGVLTSLRRYGTENATSA
jgi:hypothetical protein